MVIMTLEQWGIVVGIVCGTIFPLATLIVAIDTQARRWRERMTNGFVGLLVRVSRIEERLKMRRRSDNEDAEDGRIERNGFEQ